MPIFENASEVYRYVGGIYRAAAEHPEVGSQLAAAALTLRVQHTDPDAVLTIRLHEPMTVEEGGPGPDADVVLTMPADIADRYWRGEYNLAVGLAKGKVQATGDIARLLPLLPLTKPLFPVYRRMMAGREADRSAY
ncbi:hypothetical protein DSM112329_04523 [Paraconexibacter sp. AEG42_29]|uniref:SCP2 domain-containing protein n=1 Tax=Paraconexibacter sp. AEG42_29 TaxID=2997339 RepID=A0AAU7B182_9ACTN